jgi:hypothetical protein
MRIESRIRITTSNNKAPQLMKPGSAGILPALLVNTPDSPEYNFPGNNKEKNVSPDLSQLKGEARSSLLLLKLFLKA